MGASRVVAPDGRVWTVGRRWMGDRPRLRRSEREPDFDGGHGSEDDGSWWSELPTFDDITPAAILAALAFTILLAVLFTVVVPLVAIALELVLLLILAGAGLVGRILFRRPWIVEARAGHQRLEWGVPGWRASGAFVQRVSERIAAGEDPRRIEVSLGHEDQLHVGR